MSEINNTAKVVTVTLNPFLDRTLVTHFLTLGYHNRTTETTRLDPAGRGISISRALHSLGIPSEAILLIGHDPTGRAYQALLVEEQFPIAILRREGHTPSRIILKDTGHNQETIVWEDGDSVTEQDVQLVADTLENRIEPGDTVVFAGSLPPGVEANTYARLTKIAQAKGAQVAINAGGGEALQQALTAHPDLVYLNQVQAEGLFNYPVRVYQDVITCAHKLREQGAGSVLIAMNETSRVIMATDRGVWMAGWPDAAEGTQSGRAEALVAGYLAGRLNQFARDEALELGAAAATYTVAQLGQEFGTLKDIQERTAQVTVTSADDVEQASDLIS